MSTELQSVLPIISSPIESRTLSEILQTNHEEHSIFFDGGKHNHLAHVLLSNYALGATDLELQEEFDRQKGGYIEKLLRPNPDVIITSENWHKYIGDPSWYPNFLPFFHEEVEKLGSLGAILKWLEKPDFLASVVGGAVHPLIHLGFGLEFDSKILVVEGLCMAAGSKPTPKGSIQRIQTETNRSLSEIYELVSEDPELKVSYTPTGSMVEKTAQQCSQKISEYASMYHIKETPEGILEALQEIYRYSCLIYASTPYDPSTYKTSKQVDYTKIKPDFFLLHVLTSALALRMIIPYLTIQQAKTLLYSHIGVGLLWYVRCGTPKFNIDAFMKYPIPEEIRNWSDIQSLSLRSHDIHVSKIIRSCLIGEQLLSGQTTTQTQGFFDGTQKVDRESIWFLTSVMTIDWMVLKNRYWFHKGCGQPTFWEAST